MTYSTIEITAFAEADLLSGGDTNLGCGDTFTMPAGASLCISVTDNDSRLSSDRRDQARDHTGQNATIEDASGNDVGNGGQIYAESYLRVKDAMGNSYILIEIEQEGSNSDYFTFYTGQGYTVPPAGTELTVHSYCNVGSIPYSCLDAGPKAPSTGTISGTAWCDVDCDGIQDGTTTVEKGANIFTDSVTFESVTCTQYNVSKYGSWYSVGARVIDLVVGNAQGHHGNPHDNTLVELDKGGVWCRQFDVAQAGTFCLVLDVFKNSCISDANNAFKIKINGQTVETVTVNADGTVEVELDLAAGANRIDFVSLSGVSGRGVGIDNIKLQPLTEVTTLTEPVKEGMVVKLLNADGTAVLDGNGQPITTTTDANGNYAFENVPVGDYKVMGVAPDGTEFTLQGAGSSRSRDSDVDSTGTSGVISVAAGQTTDVDLGLKEVKPGALSGRYFCDVDRDDLDDGDNGGDPAVANILVTLLDANGQPVLGANNQPVTTMTDALGNYSFTGLAPGTYGVQFAEVPVGKELVASNAGGNQNDDVDSDAMLEGGLPVIQGIVVFSEQTTTDNDVGVRDLPGALSGTYFCDDDGDAVDDGAANGDADVSGKLVTLFEADGTTPATDIDGNAVVAVRTDANGDYSFTNLAARDYVVQFEDSAAEGKAFVAPNANQSGTQDSVDDSDVLGQDGKTAPVSVVAGQETKNVDAGVKALLGSLSGRYFCDDNRDGLDNDANNAVANVEVTLLGANGRPVLVGGVAVTTMTDALGNYSFAGLAEGTYGVRFGEIPVGKELTIQDVNSNGNDDIDSDAGRDRSGLPTINGISVVAGQDTPNNDAGVVDQPGALSGRYFCDENRNDVDDSGDGAVARKTVTLFEADGITPARDAFGNTVAPVVTEDDGTYRFEDLAARDYVVMFEDSVAEGKQFVAPDANQSGTQDSVDDSDVLGTDGKTAPVTVVAGQETRDVDAGVFTPNVDPTATGDSGKGCADELITVDLADNFSDPDSASVSITMVDGQAIADGQTILVDGTATLMGGGTFAFDDLEVTRSGDTFEFKGEDAFAGLDIGQEATASISFKFEDSDGGIATANMDVTFKGDANSVDSFFGSFPSGGTYELTYALDGSSPFAAFAYDLTFLNTGDARLDGVTFTEAYCIDFATAARTVAQNGPDNVGTFFGAQSAAALAAYDPNTLSTANGLSGAENADLVNWVIAQNFEDQGFSGWEVQFAIWELADNFDASIVDYNLFTLYLQFDTQDYDPVKANVRWPGRVVPRG